jgi:hypothetical protein
MKKVMLVSLLVLFVVGVSVQAATTTMWFGTSATISTPITSQVVANGATFPVYVYATTDFATDTFDLALGYDRTSNNGTTRLDNKIALNYLFDEDTEANDIPDFTASSLLTGSTSYGTLINVAEGALNGTGTVPYGLDAAYVKSAGTRAAFTARLVGTINLVNVGNASNYPVNIFDAGQGFSVTSLVGDTTSSTYARPGTHSLIINPVPEPITLVLLSLGGLFLRRRMA